MIWGSDGLFSPIYEFIWSAIYCVSQMAYFLQMAKAPELKPNNGIHLPLKPKTFK